MYLHISLVEGWVELLEFVEPKDKASFFGWKGFTVVLRHSENFNEKLLQLFLAGKLDEAMPKYPRTLCVICFAI